MNIDRKEIQIELGSNRVEVYQKTINVLSENIENVMGAGMRNSCFNWTHGLVRDIIEPVYIEAIYFVKDYEYDQ